MVNESDEVRLSSAALADEEEMVLILREDALANFLDAIPEKILALNKDFFKSRRIGELRGELGNKDGRSHEDRFKPLSCHSSYWPRSNA
jgi:hypothetical protein